jgi:hypothetical protein
MNIKVGQLWQNKKSKSVLEVVEDRGRELGIVASRVAMKNIQTSAQIIMFHTTVFVQYDFVSGPQP